MVSKSSLIMTPKDSLLMVPKGSEKFLNNGSKRFLSHSSKRFLNNDSKKFPKSTLKVKMLKKTKSKFAAGQLKSPRSPLQHSTQSLIFAYPIMHNGQILFKNLSTFAVKLSECLTTLKHYAL